MRRDRSAIFLQPRLFLRFPPFSNRFESSSFFRRGIKFPVHVLWQNGGAGRDFGF